MKVPKDGEARNGEVSSNAKQKSYLINGPQEYSINEFNNSPWKGKLRYSSIIHGGSQPSFGNSHNGWRS